MAARPAGDVPPVRRTPSDARRWRPPDDSAWQDPSVLEREHLGGDLEASASRVAQGATTPPVMSGPSRSAAEAWTATRLQPAAALPRQRSATMAPRRALR